VSVRDSVYTVRPYEDRDEQQVIELLRTSMGQGEVRAADLFRWKHLQNPFGRSLLLVAEDGEGIIGLRAFLRWRFRAGKARLAAARPVDTATHPSHRRHGVFSSLTRAALGGLPDGTIVFNTPNERSLAGYRKMGWQVAGKVPVSVRIRRPVRLLTGPLRSPRSEGGPIATGARPAGEVLGDSRLPALLAEGAGPPAERLATDRDQRYLRWRYGDAPALRYQAVVEEDGAALSGIALFRLRWRRGRAEAAVAEVVATDRPTTRRLLRRVARAGAVDYVVGSFPGAVAHDAVRAGFVRMPFGPTLAVRPPADPVSPSPAKLSSWWLTLGDLEVF
jgi:hypothetical protein